jgi:hypothetical protein
MSCSECNQPDCLLPDGPRNVYSAIRWCDACRTSIEYSTPGAFSSVTTIGGNNILCSGLHCTDYSPLTDERAIDISGPEILWRLCGSDPFANVYACDGFGIDGPRPEAAWGKCCVPRTYMEHYHPGWGGCTVWATERCCSNLGGVWPGVNYETFICSECPSEPSCCGCDWCCDEVSAVVCSSEKTYPWENLPIPSTRACIGNSCPQTPPAPVCRREEFALGRRPTAHEPPERGGTGHVGRHELHSVGPVRAIDRAPGTEECRTYYGHVGRDAPVSPVARTVGWLCGQYNRRAATTKRANRCYLSKRPDGRHSFQCAYRVPCPEKPAVCL